MKHSLFLFLLFLCSSSFAAPKGLGVGVVIGSPTALSAKVDLAGPGAMDFGLAFSFNDSLLIFSDYLHEIPGGFGRSEEFLAQCTPYVGIGGLIAFSEKDFNRDERYRSKTKGSFGAAVRIPLGFEWSPRNPPIGIFLELVPSVSIIPETSSVFFAGIGVRYYF